MPSRSVGQPGLSSEEGGKRCVYRIGGLLLEKYEMKLSLKTSCLLKTDLLDQQFGYVFITVGGRTSEVQLVGTE